MPRGYYGHAIDDVVMMIMTRKVLMMINDYDFNDND